MSTRAIGLGYLNNLRGRPVEVRYGVGVVVFGLAVSTLLLLDRYLDPSFAPLLIGAAAFTAWFCGLGPALLVTALSSFSYYYLFTTDRFTPHNASNLVRLLFFVVVTVFISLLIYSLAEARDAIAISERRYRSIGELLPFGVWTATRDGKLVHLSDSLLEFLGKPPGSVQTWREIVYGDDAEDVAREWQECIRSLKLWDREFTIRDRSGNVRAILSSGMPILSARGRVTSWAGINLDITERHRIEEERQRHSEDLARSNAELESFAYIASHDLQEPLRTMKNFLQLLDRRYRGRLDADADEFINFCVNGADRLQRMVNGLLQFSRAGRQQLSFKRLDSSIAVRQAVQNLGRKIEDSHAAITWGELPCVQADESALTQLFQNLVDNSIKYCADAPPVVHVSASVANGVCTFAVHDNGIGFEPRYAERVFVIFQRLHNSEYPGMGIGLALAKRIVERHGGRIWVETQKGEGSTFFFTVPAADKIEVAPEASPLRS